MAADSDVETFCALRLFIDSWRWAGVPWYLRSGKCLPTTAAEVLVRAEARRRSGCSTTRRPTRPQPTTSASGCSPMSAIALAARVKRPGKDFVGDQRELYLLRRPAPARSRPTSGCSATRWPAMARSSRARTRSRRPGRWSTRCSSTTRRRCPTSRGSWGPAAADALIAGDGGWHDPRPEARPPMRDATHDDTDVVFLLDVDNTLLDNDRVIADLRRAPRARVRRRQRATATGRSSRSCAASSATPTTSARCSATAPSIQRRSATLLPMSSFLRRLSVRRPAVSRRARRASRTCARSGPTVILSDGDVVFQPRKVERSGLWDAVDGRVLIYIHKERDARRRRAPLSRRATTCWSTTSCASWRR